MDIPSTPTNNSFGFRPLPGQVNSNSDSKTAANNAARPKMTLPKVSKTAVDPFNDKTRYVRMYLAKQVYYILSVDINKSTNAYLYGYDFMQIGRKQNINPP